VWLIKSSSHLELLISGLIEDKHIVWHALFLENMNNTHNKLLRTYNMTDRVQSKRKQGSTNTMSQKKTKVRKHQLIYTTFIYVTQMMVGMQ